MDLFEYFFILKIYNLAERQKSSIDTPNSESHRLYYRLIPYSEPKSDGAGRVQLFNKALFELTEPRP